MSNSRAGDLLAGRYRLDDLMSESDHGRFWRGFDQVLARTVSVHALLSDDPRCPALLDAARASARLTETHLLRVLDIDSRSGTTFVINEWGSGTSLDHLVAVRGPLSPRAAAWLAGEVAAALTVAHEAGVAHGRLIPENVLIDKAGSVRIIGFAVEAALHGLPTGRTDEDLVDLAGILETALTGRWAGLSDSAVPRVPTDHGGLLDRDRDHVLTPRQLQPGVPGVLDDLCHEILNRPHGRHSNRLSAREIHNTLAAFVGDPADLHEEAIELSGTGQSTPRTSAPAGSSAPTVDPERTGPLALSDLPTQQGTPIFEEDGDVGWLSRADLTTIRPPAPESDPERPLFAPQHQHRVPRHPAAAPPPEPTAGEPTSVERFLSAPAGVEVDPPRAGWMLRSSVIIGVVALLAIAVVLAYSLTRPTPTTSPTASVSPSATAPAPIRGVTALDFDPSGTPPTENRDLVGRVVDGNTATAWRSLTYRQQFGPGGLKSGLGVILDLHGSYTVTAVDLTFVKPGTTVQLYTSDAAPTAVTGLDRVASITAGTTEKVTLVTPTRARYVTLWFTALPQVSDGYRVELSEASVSGLA